MGKKRGSVVPHKEAFMRMNYLFQASLAMLSASPGHPELSRFYIHTMRSVSKRLVLRMDPSLKRMFCKSCDTLLVPGVTSTHRLRACREKHVVVRCLTCGTVKRFLARANYQLWSEDPSNVAQPATTEIPPIANAAPHTTTQVPPTPTTLATEVPLPTNMTPNSSATTVEPSEEQDTPTTIASSATTPMDQTLPL